MYLDLTLNAGNGGLSWPEVSVGNIKAVMSNITNTKVRVTLREPKASSYNDSATAPLATLPATLNIKGYKNGKVSAEYSFTLTKWFINRGQTRVDNFYKAQKWRENLGYVLPSNYDFGNAGVYKFSPSDSDEKVINFEISTNKNSEYLRNINSGLFSEWGYLNSYSLANFIDGIAYNDYVLRNIVGNTFLKFWAGVGHIYQANLYDFDYGKLNVICVTNGKPASKTGTTTVKFSRPDMTNTTGEFAGPTSQWDENSGFKVQSTTDYSKNFPTTGANNLYFDLIIDNGETGVKWSDVTEGSITAKVSDVSSGRVRVTLQGPVASSKEVGAKATKPNLPATFELVGYKDGRQVAKYGFVIKFWFVHARGYGRTYDEARAWCNSLGNYTIPEAGHLSNTSIRLPNNDASIVNQPSGFNHYTRIIGSGILSEWGNLYRYDNSGFIGRTVSHRSAGNCYWVNSGFTTNPTRVYVENGNTWNDTDNNYYDHNICISK